MNRQKTLFVVSVLFLGGAWAFRQATTAAPRSASAASEDSAGSQTLAAAAAMLESLDAKQREKTVFDFADKERINWHFIPRDRKGLAVKEMTAPQKEKLQALLAAGLSETGHRTVEAVRGLEEILGGIEGPNRRFPRDPELYYLSIFGKPAKEGRWGWRFEGHHVSLNFTHDGGRILSATPFFLGANPALVPDGPKKGLRVLAGVEDVARELVKSLDEDQLKTALGKDKPAEVASAESAKYTGPFPSGLGAGKLTREQRRILRRLLEQYTQHFAAEVREATVQEIRAAGLDGIQIAWFGSLEPFEPHSYIVHGKTFVISYANFQNDARHVHSAFRNLASDFGLEESESGGK